MAFKTGFSNNSSLIQPFVNGIYHKATPINITTTTVKINAIISFFVISFISSRFGLFLYNSLHSSTIPPNYPTLCFFIFSSKLSSFAFLSSELVFRSLSSFRLLC